MSRVQHNRRHCPSFALIFMGVFVCTTFLYLGLQAGTVLVTKAWEKQCWLKPVWRSPVWLAVFDTEEIKLGNVAAKLLLLSLFRNCLLNSHENLNQMIVALSWFCFNHWLSKTKSLVMIMDCGYIEPSVGWWKQMMSIIISWTNFPLVHKIIENWFLL